MTLGRRLFKGVCRKGIEGHDGGGEGYGRAGLEVEWGEGGVAGDDCGGGDEVEGSTGAGSAGLELAESREGGVENKMREGVADDGVYGARQQFGEAFGDGGDVAAGLGDDDAVDGLAEGRLAGAKVVGGAGGGRAGGPQEHRLHHHGGGLSVASGGRRAAGGSGQASRGRGGVALLLLQRVGRAVGRVALPAPSLAGNAERALGLGADAAEARRPAVAGAVQQTAARARRARGLFAGGVEQGA